MRTISARFYAWAFLLVISVCAPAVSAQPCSGGFGPAARTHGYAGATSYVAFWVDCPWTLRNTNSWITIHSATNGPTGGGQIDYTVALNTSPQVRRGNIEVSGLLFPITQAQGHAVITSHPTNQTVIGGGTATFSATILGEPPITYQWQLNMQPLVNGHGISGADTPTLVLSNVQSSQAGGYRLVMFTGGVSVYSQTATLTVSCDFALSASNATFSSLSTTSSVSLSTITPLCFWSVVNTNPWVTILSSLTGNGDGTVVYALSANTTGADRNGLIRIADKTFALTQRAGLNTGPGPSLAEALDTEGVLDWDTIGIPAWIGQTIVSKDGVDAAQSGAINHGAAVTAVSVIEGPGQLSFWWKVSSEPGKDYLKFFVNGVQQTRISGETDWAQLSYTFPSGTHTTKWTYSKSPDVTEGQDRGWVDQVQFVAGPNTNCPVTLSQTEATYSHEYATGQVTVTTPGGCAWNFITQASWIAPLVDGDDGVFRYSVHANETAMGRTGAVFIAGQTFTVVQEGAPCFYTLSSTSRTHDYRAATNNFWVTARTGCSWNVVNTNDWITILSASNSSYGQVIYFVAENPTRDARSGNVQIAGQAFFVFQFGRPPCTYSLSPVSTTRSSAAATGVVSVLTQEGCVWNASTTNAWITISSVVSDSTSGSVFYSIAANPTSATRTGKIQIGNVSFTITQSGIVPCSYSISPSYRAHTSGAATGTVAVTTQAACAWTASLSDAAPWVTILSTATNSGGGQIVYALSSNATPVTRSASLIVAGRLFTVTQLGNPVLPSAADYDVGRDFSTAQNPNGVWAFGWAGTVTGPVQLLMVRRDSPGDNGAFTASWQLTYDTAPVVICNTNDHVVTVGGGQAALAPREVLFDGGQDGSPENFVVIQFTAPTNGHYSVATTVRPFYTGPPQGDADFHVVRNNTELFVEWLNPYQSAYYSNTLAMSAGETIKFLLGRGADGREYGSVYRIAALIHSQPVPATNPPVLPFMTLINQPPQVGEYFGDAVAGLGNDRVVIGAPYHAYSTLGGEAYLFSTNGTLLTTFTNPIPGPYNIFGDKVATVGDRVLVSSPYESIGATFAGAVYLFSTNGTLLTTFTNPTALPGKLFGSAVAALGNDRVLIGTREGYTVGRINTNSVYLFSTNGTLLTTFNYPFPSPYPTFGLSFAAVGRDRVLIGVSPAYLFDTNGTLLTVITNPAPADFHAFGNVMAGLGDDRMLISAYQAPMGSAQYAGVAYLYGLDGTLLTTFTNPAPASYASFGFSLTAVGSDRVLIGAPTAHLNSTLPINGAAYLFSTNGALLATLRNPTSRQEDHFGGAVAAVGSDNVVIGAYNTLNGGAAYLFSLPPTGGATNPPTICTYSIFPSSRSHGSGSSTSYVEVTTQTGCAWNVVNTNAWVTILSGAGGSGSGVVNYSVAANPASLERSGYIRMDGQSFYISQAGAAGSVDFAEAIDVIGAPIRVWHNGSPNWLGQTAVTHDGLDAAVGTGGSFSLVVTGAGTLTFWWKLSSPTNSTVRLYLGGAEQLRITGETDWQQQTFAVPAGVQTLEWYFAKNAGSPEDRAYVDQVQFVPTPTCSVALSPGSAVHSSMVSTGLISVATASNCAWTVFNTNSWITLASGASGTGSGLVRYIAAANPNAFSRSGYLNISGQHFQIMQTGGNSGTNPPACTYVLSPASRTHGYGSSTNFVSVTTSSSCLWLVNNTNSWITVLSALTNAGGGTVAYFVAANPATSGRSGTIRIDGQNFVVTQSGNNTVTNPPSGCTITISPTLRVHAFGGGTGLVAVATQAGCAWNVVNTNAWVSILSSLEQTNSGSVHYSLSANTNAASRSGHLLIGGLPFRLIQQGTFFGAGTNAARVELIGLPGTNATLSVQGDAGKMYILLSSEDLLNWVPVATNSAPSTFTDVTTGTTSRRFYRVVEMP